MYTRLPPHRIPEIKFRVLIVGRANAGKTSILQRVCETTESVIWCGNEVIQLQPSILRGEHSIDDELVFSNMGFVFHDYGGFEAGSSMELEIVKEFIQRKCSERRLQDRLHAIWYCVPMDKHQPELNLKYFKDICPDPTVPVIVVFTKYDQFLYNVEMHLEDHPNDYPNSNVSDAAERQFKERWLGPLGNDVIFVRLKNMHLTNSCCDQLIKVTATALNEDIVTLMLSHLILTSRPGLDFRGLNRAQSRPLYSSSTQHPYLYHQL